jgi:hypothetical protein
MAAAAADLWPILNSDVYLMAPNVKYLFSQPRSGIFACERDDVDESGSPVTYVEVFKGVRLDANGNVRGSASLHPTMIFSVVKKKTINLNYQGMLVLHGTGSVLIIMPTYVATAEIPHDDFTTCLACYTGSGKFYSYLATDTHVFRIGRIVPELSRSCPNLQANKFYTTPTHILKNIRIYDTLVEDRELMSSSFTETITTQVLYEVSDPAVQDTVLQDNRDCLSPFYHDKTSPPWHYGGGRELFMGEPGRLDGCHCKEYSAGDQPVYDIQKNCILVPPAPLANKAAHISNVILHLTVAGIVLKTIFF